MDSLSSVVSVKQCEVDKKLSSSQTIEMLEKDDRDSGRQSSAARNDKPKPLGGHQPYVIAEPRSPIAPWQMPVIKQEPAEDERNDSGVASAGSDGQSSPGSEHGQDINIQNRLAYYAKEFSSYALQFFDMNPSTLTTFKNNQLPSMNGQANMSGDITNRASPKSLFGNDNENILENADHIRRLQTSMEKSGLLSPKGSDNSNCGDARSDIDMNEDVEGLDKPKLNSHGKVKRLKCKQCTFVAFTKVDFWQHSREHIKPDKLLTCHRCPFVTEYKHHLEYHIRNHDGSKPYKCKNCTYTCVNKSMLNSHMKSHSNFYEYHCADCSYATKYCHSLKLHLRKSRHRPAMVRNPDGSPNPFPIIDVYGTRRGPKRMMTPKGPSSPPVPPPVTQDILPNSLAQFMLNSQLLQQQLLANMNALPSPLLFQPNLMQMAHEILPETSAVVEKDAPQSSNSCDVLDLSKSGIQSPDSQFSRKNRRKGISRRVDVNNIESVDGNEDDDDLESDKEGNDINSNQICDHFRHRNEENYSDTERMDDEQAENTNNDAPKEYVCQYCLISFGDVVLHSIHMGYHDHKDPFTCNMCGQRCTDKISFFLHIARVSHS